MQSELYALARVYLNRDRRGQTLQPTALINEVYLRLIDETHPVKWECRSHFYGIAARLMRQILVDYARAHRAIKRGGEAVPVTLDEIAASLPGRTPNILEVNDALSRLAKMDDRKAKIIELRYFAGMNREEIATVCGLTISTVKRDLRLAEAWLRRELKSVS